MFYGLLKPIFTVLLSFSEQNMNKTAEKNFFL